MLNYRNPAVERAVELAIEGASILSAAKAEGVSIGSVRRAMRKLGHPPRQHPRGDQHHAWIDGRTARRRPAQDHAAQPCADE